MLREKPANVTAVNNLIEYLKQVRWTLKGTGADADFTELQRSYKVAKRTYSDLKALGIVKLEGQRHVWLVGEAYRAIALQILDKRLKKSKKTLHVPIPEFIAFGEVLSTIADRLAHISMQNEKLLKSPKNAIIDVNGHDDLFHVEDQRLYIAGQIASGYYNHVKFCDHTYVSVPGNRNGYGGNVFFSASDVKDIPAISGCIKCGFPVNPEKQFTFEEINDTIVKATDDLMSKLLKREPTKNND